MKPAVDVGVYFSPVEIIGALNGQLVDKTRPLHLSMRRSSLGRYSYDLIRIQTSLGEQAFGIEGEDKIRVVGRLKARTYNPDGREQEEEGLSARVGIWLETFVPIETTVGILPACKAEQMVYCAEGGYVASPPEVRDRSSIFPWRCKPVSLGGRLSLTSELRI